MDYDRKAILTAVSSIFPPTKPSIANPFRVLRDPATLRQASCNARGPKAVSSRETSRFRASAPERFGIRKGVMRVGGGLDQRLLVLRGSQERHRFRVLVQAEPSKEFWCGNSIVQ